MIPRDEEAPAKGDIDDEEEDDDDSMDEDDEESVENTKVVDHNDKGLIEDSVNKKVKGSSECLNEGFLKRLSLNVRIK